MSFWDTFDDRPVDVHPGFEQLAPMGTCPPDEILPALATVARENAQNDLVGVCAFCGLASDDVLLGVCADCVEDS